MRNSCFNELFIMSTWALAKKCGKSFLHNKNLNFTKGNQFSVPLKLRH